MASPLYCVKQFIQVSYSKSAVRCLDTQEPGEYGCDKVAYGKKLTLCGIAKCSYGFLPTKAWFDEFTGDRFPQVVEAGCVDIDNDDEEYDDGIEPMDVNPYG